jgi:hypothetical protein
MNTILKQTIAEPDQRVHDAYHEAGHTVMGYYFGWFLNPEGVVEIGDQPYCDLRSYRWDNAEFKSVSVCLAGWGAEMRIAPHLALPREADHLADLIFDVRYEGGDFDDTDDGKVLARLLQTRPDASDDDLITVYRSYEAQTASILRQSDVWSSIERVANALLQHGKLSHDDVVDLIRFD